MATRATAQTRSILVQLANGDELIVSDIPANAKVTFGALQPGSRGDYRGTDTAVRVYTTAGNQLAVFRDARSFRDLSLGVKVKQVKTDSSESTERGPRGSKRQASEVRTTDWVDA